MISSGNRARPLRHALRLVAVTIFCSIPAHADEFCSEPLPLAEGVEPAMKQLSMFSELIALPGLDNPIVDLGAKTILTIEDGELVPFEGPPLDLWNRLMPVLVRWSDGEVWAYSRVRPKLYRLDPDVGAFVPLPFDGSDTIRGFSASGTLRRHEDRFQDRSNDGVPPLYAHVDEGLAEITREGMMPVLLPQAWRAGGWVPITAAGLGRFLPVGGEIWFRRTTRNGGRLRALRMCRTFTPSRRSRCFRFISPAVANCG